LVERHSIANPDGTASVDEEVNDVIVEKLNWKGAAVDWLLRLI